MKETDRYTSRLASENTWIGEWKGDAFDGQKVRVSPDGMFTFGGSPLNEAGGDMWIDLNNSDVDFAIGDAHTIGPYTYSPKPDKVAFTSGTSVERLSDYNIKWATNGH